MTDPGTPNDQAPLTEEELAELERLEKQATPPPWARVWLDLPRMEDRRFLAELRNAAPSLIAEVRRLRAEMASLRALAVSTDLQEH